MERLPTWDGLLMVRGFGVTKLARALGLSHVAVSHWLKTGIPADRVVAVEEVTGIPRQKLRPDLYAGIRA